MKVLKYVLGFLGIVIVAFLMIGVFVPSFRYETTIDVNAPVATSWSIFNDESRMGEWLIGFQNIETISGNPGEVGSKYRLVFLEGDETIVMTEEMTAVQENELVAFKFDNDLMTGTFEVRFRGDESKTTIATINELQGKNIVWRSLLWLSKTTIRERAQANYARLKELIEASPMGQLSENVSEQ